MRTKDKKVEESLARTLHEIAGRDVPAGLDLWPAIEARLGPRRSRSPWGRFRPANRLGWASLALVAFLFLGALGYALGPAVGRLFTMVPSWQYLEENDLLHEVHLAQTVAGVTVTIERVYADAHQVIVGYSVSGLADPATYRKQVSLTNGSGTTFREMMGAGVWGSSELLDVSLPEGDASYLMAFDGAAVEGAPSNLQLHLEMRLTEWIAANPEGEFGPAEGSPADLPASAQVLVPMEGREGATVGPFAFDFAVPFLPARVANVGQTAQASGIGVRLETVAVTPAETRVSLCFQTTQDLDWAPIGTLHTGSGRNHQVGFEVRDRIEEAGGDVCYVYGLLTPLAEERGTWRLKITELAGFEMTEPYDQTRFSGPWEFVFPAP